MPDSRGRRTPDEKEIDALRVKYRAHRQDMIAQGHDPDFIGVTEVVQPTCPCCHNPLPWALIALLR